MIVVDGVGCRLREGPRRGKPDGLVVGVIGPTCSVAAIAASPLLSEAGLVTISPTNTAPSLTSDLSGHSGPDYYAGYYRTASNDLHEARTVAQFAFRELGLRRMAAIHDGDPVNASARLTRVVVNLVEDRLGESEPSREVRAELSRVADAAAPRPNEEPLPGLHRAGKLSRR